MHTFRSTNDGDDGADDSSGVEENLTIENVLANDLLASEVVSDDVLSDDSAEDSADDSSGSDWFDLDVGDNVADHSLAGPSRTVAGREQEEGEEEEEEEDNVVKAIRKARENIKEIPRDIVCEDHVVEISFHPQEHIIALASINGDVLLYRYCDDKDAELVNTLELHTKACRDIEFSADGSTLFSISKDKSMLVSNVDTGQLKQSYDNAHSDPLYCIKVLNENQVVTGDETGTVKMWDLRQQKSLFMLKESSEYVSDMITTDAQRHLVCACGDGSLTVLNLPGRKLHMQSEMYDVDLNCLGLLRIDSKLVVGTSDGNLLFFNWGEFGYHNNEYPGPKSAINHLVTATENIVITACDDGNLRAVHLFHHRYLGIIGQHPFSVEALDISGDGRLVASCSHEQVVKFWDIKYLEDVKVEESVKQDKKKRTHNLPSSRVTNRADFFAGLAD